MGGGPGRDAARGFGRRVVEGRRAKRFEFRQCTSQRREISLVKNSRSWSAELNVNSPTSSVAGAQLRHNRSSACCAMAILDPSRMLPLMSTRIPETHRRVLDQPGSESIGSKLTVVTHLDLPRSAGPSSAVRGRREPMPGS